MVDIIMKHMFKYHVTQLKHEDYNIITAKIITLFPTEATRTYYIPSVRKKDSFNRNQLLLEENWWTRPGISFIKMELVPVKGR
ncbi:hypothetical protein JTB14_027901 [Gonioctena quinquepunctata]|nr:hypothetical protein JTB14_027901 [Gonioctena quinquepunctata]